MRDKVLAGKKGKLLKKYDGFDLAHDAAARFLDLQDQLRSAENQVHLLMQAFATATVEAVRKSDLPTVLSIWSFLEKVLSNPQLDPELANAVRISFLNQNDLLINDSGKEALEKMPPRLRQLVAEAYPPA